MEEVNKETWNKKKVFLAVFLLVLLVGGGFFFKTRFLADSSQKTDVKGASTIENVVESTPGVSIQDAVKEKIDNLKQEVSGLNIVEVASSSPQVQKILNDIKALQQYPTNQIKELCRKICGL